MNNNIFLTSKISSLTNGVIQELSNPNKHKMDEYLDLLRNPWAKACVDIKSQRAAASFGEYKHNNLEITKFINENIENMLGTLPDVVSTLCGAMPFGHMVAEIAIKQKSSFRKKKWMLAGFNVLDPSRVHYAGHWGQLTHVVYRDGERDKWLKYEKCIHITNGNATNFNKRTAYGDPECEAAFPYIKLYNLIMSEMAVSAKTLATGILYGQADTDATVQVKDERGKNILDSQGKPITRDAVQYLADQLHNLENHAYIVTDKKNIVTALNVPAGEQFWSMSEGILRRAIFASFGVPSMVLDEGTGALATATLSTNHLSVLDAKVRAVVTQIQDQLIEKVIRPLIIWNWGYQEDYGDFTIGTKSDPAADMALASAQMTAVSMGIVSSSDIPAINTIRRKLQLPEITQEDQASQAQMQAQLAALQQGQPPTEETPPEEQQTY